MCVLQSTLGVGKADCTSFRELSAHSSNINDGCVVLPKWAKFNDLTRHRKMYQEVFAKTQLLAREYVDDPTKQEVVAPAPWPFQLWFVHADCEFFYSTPIASHVEPPSLRRCMY
jgi:hypothetical protein